MSVGREERREAATQKERERERRERLRGGGGKAVMAQQCASEVVRGVPSW